MNNKELGTGHKPGSLGRLNYAQQSEIYIELHRNTSCQPMPSSIISTFRIMKRFAQSGRLRGETNLNFSTHHANMIH